MTDTLQVAPIPPLIDDADRGCGCCIRPPADVADRVAELEARREALERRLRGLGGSSATTA